MKKALIFISIFIGILVGAFLIGSWSSQKVFAEDCGCEPDNVPGCYCGVSCGDWTGSCGTTRCGFDCGGGGGCDSNAWGGCSASCGPGTQRNDCGDTRDCNNGACCDPNNWGGWGACSVACGGGTQTRTNACGTPDTQRCNTQACVVPTATPIPTPGATNTPPPQPTSTPGPSPTPPFDSPYEIPIGGKENVTVNIAPIPQVKFATTLFGVEKRPDVAVRVKVADIGISGTGPGDGCQEPKTGEIFYKDIMLTANASGTYSGKPLTTYTYNNLLFAVSKDGWISLPGSTPGKAYSIGVKGPKHRNIRMVESITLANKTPTAQDFNWVSKPLEPGDVPDPNNNWKQDCTVNSIDLSLVESRIGKTDAESNKVADINYENVVNGSDVSKIVNTLKTKPDDDP